MPTAAGAVTTTSITATTLTESTGSLTSDNGSSEMLPLRALRFVGSGAWFPKGEPRSIHGQDKEKENKEMFRDKKISNFDVYIQEAERLMRSLVPTSSPEVPGPLLLTPAYLQMMTNASKFSSQDDIIQEMQTILLNTTPED